MQCRELWILVSLETTKVNSESPWQRNVISGQYQFCKRERLSIFNVVKKNISQITYKNGTYTSVAPFEECISNFYSRKVHAYKYKMGICVNDFQS